MNFNKLTELKKQALVEELSKQLAVEVKSLRLERGISRNELSQLSGISRPTITTIEDSKVSPSVGTLVKILYCLDQSCSQAFKSIEERAVSSIQEGDELNEEEVGYNPLKLDEAFEKAVFKLRRKAKTNPDLRTTVIDLSKLQTVYHQKEG